MKLSLKISLCIALGAALFFPSLAPKMHLCFFSPYLVLCFYKCSLFSTWMRAIGCGIFLDLLSSTTLFGFTPLNYCLTSFFLYSQKKHFFEDKLSTLPLMTALFSSVSTLITMIWMFMASHFFLQFTFTWAMTDLVLMSFLDGLYALLFFSLPFQITHKIHRLFLYRRKK